MMNEKMRSNEKDESFDLRLRMKKSALRALRLCGSLPGDPETMGMRRQLIHCGTSVGAQYREACRARSPAEFRSKMQSSLQELDETAYWCELLVESERVSQARMAELASEADGLIAIFVASIKTSAQAG